MYQSTDDENRVIKPSDDDIMASTRDATILENMGFKTMAGLKQMEGAVFKEPSEYKRLGESLMGSLTEITRNNIYSYMNAEATAINDLVDVTVNEHADELSKILYVAANNMDRGRSAHGVAKGQRVERKLKGG